MISQHPLIAREGWVHLGVVTLICLAASMAFGWWALPLWLLWLFVVQFFRDPTPVIPTTLDDGSQNADELVISPANGRIVALVETEDPYQQKSCLLVSVFMNVFSIHSNRSPVSGTVRQRSYFAGKFLNAALEKSSSENERNALIIETNSGIRVTTVQIAGLVARRILCYINEGDSVTAGERYGFIRFGSRVDVYLPLDAKVRVSLGDKVSSGSSVLATI